MSNRTSLLLQDQAQGFKELAYIDPLQVCVIQKSRGVRVKKSVYTVPGIVTINSHKISENPGVYLRIFLFEI